MLLAPSGKGRKRQKKGDFGRFRPISRKGGQTPLKPPICYTPICGSPTKWTEIKPSRVGWPGGFVGMGRGGVCKGKRISLPKDPNLEKIFKILKLSSEIENFKRATHQTPIFFVGNPGGQD